MPGSVQNAIPLTVMPWSLSRAFVEVREYQVLENEYRNGESQRSVQAFTSRKRWRLAKRLTPAQVAILRAFYLARGGPLEPFYFYNPYETVPPFSYDPTGQSPVGRYTVRFDCAWEQSSGPGLINVQIEIVEIG